KLTHLLIFFFWLFSSPFIIFFLSLISFFIIIFSPFFGFLISLTYMTHREKYIIKNAPDLFKNKGIQDIVYEWADTIRQKHKHQKRSTQENEEDKVESYRGDPLLVVEWDE